MLRALANLARSTREEAEPLDPEILPLLSLIGFDAESGHDIAHEVGTIVDQGVALGLDRSALPHVLQAYVRAVSRVVAVETTLALDALRAAEPQDRAQLIDDLLDHLLSATTRGFDLLHRSMLLEALVEGAGGVTAPDADADALAVAMVDLVGSTDHLARNGTDDLERMVDALFAAAQSATHDRPARTFKYAGDGVFISASDPITAADAALELVQRLEAELPLRARGGLDVGPVVQRAGDVFGLPVNMAQALTKAAKPGTVLLSAGAAALLPPERHGRVQLKRLPHSALGAQRVAVLKLPQPCSA